MAKKTDQLFQYPAMRASVVAVASCLALLGAPALTYAAGLGKVVVQSALGQPLRAEIEVSATREELADMKAQLASPEAFKQAGLDYAATLAGIRFSIDKRAGGQTFIRLTSEKPISDPFVDMLVELSWPTGRLVREYTFLLDPPEVAAKAAAPVAAPTARASAPARGPAAIDDETRGRATARVRVQDEAPKAAAPRTAEPATGQETREVRRGDTLNKIANETKYDGVTLDQMLVGLLRANREAFDGGNMNRLKAGRILTVPDKAAIESVPAAEARKVVVAQSSDWNAYRNKLAGIAAQTPGRESAAGQESAGKITAKVDDKAAPAPAAKDQLKVSPTEKAGSRAGSADRRGEEDQIAKEKALDEAKQRLVALEKNVSDLQKLVELKNQSLADLQQQAGSKGAAAGPATPEVKPEAKAEAKPEPVAPAPATPPAGEAKPADAASKPEAVKPEAAPAPKPAAPPAKPKVVAPPPPPPEEPTLLEEVLDNPLLLAGGGGVLALLAALLVVRRRRATRGEVPLSLGTSLSQQFSSLTANSIFRSTGGQSVDTSHGPAHTDFSQAGPGSIDTDEVDPVAEADVYMAYGRDAQAEEILLEARQKDPARHAIPLKLLEIYANRKDVKTFEALAGELYSETGGSGPDWEKAAAMGQKLDPDNPLYRTPDAPAKPAAQEEPAVAVAVAPVLAAAALTVDQTVSLPGELSHLADQASAAPGEATDASVDELPVVDEEPESPKVDLTSLDFDLGGGDEKMPAVAAQAPFAVEAEAKPEAGAALDFDLGADSASLAAAAQVPDLGIDFELPTLPEVPTVEDALAEAPASAEVGALDFDLVLEPLPAAAPEAPAASAAAIDARAPGDELDVQFDADMTDSTFLGRSMPEASSFDMSAIDLDLDTPEAPAPAQPSAMPATSSDGFGNFGNFGEQAVDQPFSTLQAATFVTPEPFEAVQQETLISPQRIAEAADLGEDEFTLQQGRTNVNPQLDAELEASATENLVSNEDVTTKLDLAKAYEEMGDYEGARELLQEVLTEGDAAQRAKAQFILAKIGD